MERYPFVSFKTSFATNHNSTQRAVLSAMRMLFDAERYAEVRQIQANVWAWLAHPKVGEVWYNDTTGRAVTVTEIMPPSSNTALDEQRGAVWVQNQDNTKTRYTFDEFADWRPDYEQFFSFDGLEHSDETDARDFLDDVFFQMCWALLDVVKHEGI